MPPFNLTGLPALALPCGVSSSGLPLSLQLAGRPFEEGTSLLASLERADTSVEAVAAQPNVKRVVLTVTWNGGARQASLPVVRSAVPGGHFW